MLISATMQLVWAFQNSTPGKAYSFEECVRKTNIFQCNQVCTFITTPSICTCITIFYSHRHIRHIFLSPHFWHRNWGLLYLCDLSKVKLWESVLASYSDSWSSALSATISCDLPRCQGSRTEKLNGTDVSPCASWPVRLPQSQGCCRKTGNTRFRRRGLSLTAMVVARVTAFYPQDHSPGPSVNWARGLEWRERLGLHLQQAPL